MNEKLNFEVNISASREKVWEKMLGEDGYKIWTKEFNPGGSWFEGSWEQGEKIKFLGPGEDGSVGGIVSEIAENRKNEFISIRHLGFIIKGEEVYDAPEVKAWAPAYENYTFTEIDGITKVEIYLEVSSDWSQMMKDAWPRAVLKLKEICEN